MNTLNFYFLIVTLLFLNTLTSTLADPIYFELNGHYYERVIETVDAVNATLNCEKKVWNGKKGYLATYSFEEEWAFSAANNIYTQSAAWITGSDAVKTGAWTYSSGPEKGQPMYNLFFDKCYSFCLFGGVEPNLIPNEHWVHTSGTVATPYWNNNNYLAVIPAYICEYGGLEDPTIPTITTLGGDITITNIVGMDLPSLVITFTNRDTPSTTFKCSNIKVLNSTSVSCTIPTGTGRYRAVFTDSKGSAAKNLLWQYELPFIQSIYPVFKKNEVLTIAGNNFGVSASLVKVLVGTTQTIVCGNVVMLQNHEAITCVLPQDLTEKLLPISVTVNNLRHISYKAGIFYPQNNLYYSGFLTSANWEISTKNYSLELRIDGQNGHLGTMDSPGLWTFLNNSLPLPFNNGIWSMWQGVKWNPSTSKFYYINGPKTGQIANLQYTSTNTDPSTWNDQTRFTQNMYTGLLSSVSATSASGTFTEFGGEDPAFTQVKTHYLDTNGGVADIQIDNYGTVFSKIAVDFRSLSLTYVRDFINSELDVTIPVGYGGPYPISVKVDDKTTAPNTQFIDYNAPTITSLTKVSTRGGETTITGTSFFNDPAVTSVKIGSLICTPVYIVAHTQVKCTLPVGTGILPTIVTVGTRPSGSREFYYIAPTVTSVSTSTPLGSKITIVGDNYGIDKSVISVQVGDFACTGVEITTAHTTITCTVPAGQGSHPVTVTVNYQDSNSDKNLNYNSPTFTNIVQIQDTIEITGTNFGIDLNQLQLLIGTVDITSVCSSSDTKVTCTNLPTTVISGAITTVGAVVNPSQNFLLTPYIISIDPLVIPTSGGSVSIKGRFFETSSMGVSNSLSVVFDGKTDTNNGYSSNQLLVYTVAQNTGVNKVLYIKSSTRTSNSKTISFSPPTITSFSQSNEVITLDGTNFGNDVDQISLSVGSLSISPITLISHSKLSFTAPLSTLNGDIDIIVNTQSFSFSRFTLIPIITNIPLVKVIGESITIQGKYLSNVDQDSQSTNIQFNFSSLVSTCTFISSQSYECQIPSGTGTKAVAYVINDNIRSDDFIYSYQPPTVETITNTIYNVPQQVIITGTNFANQGLGVKIGDQDCNSPLASDDTTITCQFPSTATPPTSNEKLKVQVTVDGQSSSADIFSYASFSVGSVVQVEDFIEISGFNFGDVSKLNIKLGEVVLDSCTGNNTFITCNPLSLSVESGYFDITNGPEPITPIKVLLRPYLYDINPTKIITDGQDITIKGRFFEETSITETTNTILVKTSKNSAGIGYKLVDNTTIIAQETQGSGSLDSISVSVNNRQSNSLDFGYFAPTISSVSHSTTDKRLVILGENLGTVDVVSVYFDSLVLTPTIVESTRLMVSTPETIKNNDVYIKVSDQTSNTLKVRLTPGITTVGPSPPTNGSTISLSGRFWNTPSITFYYSLLQESSPSYKPLTCKPISFESIVHTTECTLPSGYGNFSVQAIADTIVSNEFALDYQSPIVISATSLLYKSPGNVTINAQNIAHPSTVTIGGKECTNAKLLDSEHIQCFYDGSVAANDKQDPLKITVTSYHLSGSNDVFLYLAEKGCPGTPECSGNGVCNRETGVCKCFNETVTTNDCSVVDENVLPPITDDNGETTIPGLKFNFTIAITHLREINLQEQSVKVLKVSTIKWNDRYKLSDTTSYYKGGFDNDPAVLELKVTYFDSLSNIDFAGDILSMPANSIKYEISVSKWSFDNSFNYLQVIYNSKAEKTTIYNCIEVPTNITKLNVDSLSWFQVNAGGSTLNAKFSDRIIVDKRITKSSVRLLDNTDPLYQDVSADPTKFNVLTALSTPYFTEKVVIDPNFSALLRSETTTACSTKQKWKIPVIVALCSAGGVAIATGAAIFYKKKISMKKLEKSISMQSRE
ncbi:hypothetical protein CYY_006741 [Polysphondylium violaceum]|uniref:IPT/TIG domain-containing protein n=1 Tax=Polysphondylium violaceum TaxID=133409 RepID=A0A8J4PRG0_9MYCE|nr:hypothetical protein CYY_006741 [Polysphondylium violaceum]